MPPEAPRYQDYNNQFFAPLARWYPWFAVASQGAVNRGLDMAGDLAGLRLLDLCTGTGAVALEAARRGARVVGVDICEPMLAQARAALRPGMEVEFRLQSVDALDAEELAGFDLVTISLGLHDMPQGFRGDLLRALASAPVKRLLVIDYGFPSNRLLAWIYRTLVASFETVFFPQFVRAGGIVSHLEQAGFAIEAERGFFPYFFAAALATPREEEP